LRHYTLSLLNQGGENLQFLPAAYQVQGNPWAAIALIVFAVIFGTESVYEVLRVIGDPSLRVSDLLPKHWIFAPIGVLFLVWGLNQFFIGGRLVIDNGYIKCTYKRLLGEKTWMEPLSAYKGVRKKLETEEEGTGVYSLYTVWLVHKEKDKSIKVYAAWSDDEWDEMHARYSELLTVPKLPD
jgi:hypothetical protein